MWGMRLTAVLGLSLAASALAGGCGSENAPPGEIPLAPTGARIDDHRWLGEPVRVANLTVWPVLTDRPLDVGEFLTLAEAERRGVGAVHEVSGASSDAQVRQVPNGVQQEAVILEVNDAAPPQQQGQVLGSGGAVVNTLVIENQGELPILVCAGTIVKGGRQDRQIGQDFVIAAKTSVPVDAFCVEQGRWRVHDGEGSLGSGFTNEEQGIAIKSVRSSAQYESDQGKVWSEVGKALKAQSIAGTTSFVAANEEIDAASLAKRKQTERRVADHFSRLGQGRRAPVGFAYAVDGKPVTVRAFAHERLLRGHLPSFVKAMVLEAELAERARADGFDPPEASAADVVALVEALKSAAVEERQTAAGNFNLYRSVDEGFNGECRIQLRGRGPDKIVLTEDWTAR